MIKVEHSNEMDDLTLLTKNADALILGSPTKEGGNVRIYRDGSNNLALFFNADAASNEKALDIYGGVVCQNFLTVGQTALWPWDNFYVAGTARITGSYLALNNGDILIESSEKGMRGSTSGNLPTMNLNIPVSGTDLTHHKICMQIDNNDILYVQATGDGAGGIVGKRTIQYGGQCHAKVDAGAADYNPSVITSDYIITVDTTAATRAVIISTEDRNSGTPATPRIFIIKDIAGNAGANNITVSLETAGTIDGAANAVINVNYQSITVMIDGTNGYII